MSRIGKFWFACEGTDWEIICAVHWTFFMFKPLLPDVASVWSVCIDSEWLRILQPKGNYFWLRWKLDPKAQAELNFGNVSQFSNAFHWKPWLRKESMHGSISSPCVILLSSVLQNTERGIRPHSNECISPEHLWIWLAWFELLWTSPGRFTGIAAKLNWHMAMILIASAWRNEGEDGRRKGNINVICT